MLTLTTDIYRGGQICWSPTIKKKEEKPTMFTKKKVATDKSRKK